MKYEEIKDFAQRIGRHLDHQNGMVSWQMIQQRLQEEIDELREYIEQSRRKPLTDDEMYLAIRPLYQTDELARAAASISADEYRAIEAAHGIKEQK